MEGPPLGPGGEDITWPDQVAPRGRKASSTRKIKPQTSNLFRRVQFEWGLGRFGRRGFVLGSRLRRYFGFDQVFWAPGLRGPHFGGCRCCGLEEGGGVGVEGGAPGWWVRVSWSSYAHHMV